MTFSGGVPTIWTMYLAHLERTGEDAGTLRQIIIGGSAVPRALAETLQRRYGVPMRSRTPCCEIGRRKKASEGTLCCP